MDESQFPQCKHQWKEKERHWGARIVGPTTTTADLTIVQECKKCGLFITHQIGVVEYKP